jgi:hypothetical protein
MSFPVQKYNKSTLLPSFQKNVCEKYVQCTFTVPYCTSAAICDGGRFLFAEITVNIDFQKISNMSAHSLMQILFDDFGGVQGFINRFNGVPTVSVDNNVNQIKLMQGDLMDLVFIYYGPEYKFDRKYSERELRL